MPAQTKADLLKVTDKEYAKLRALVADLDDDTACLKDADGISIKDIIAHRAHWIDLFLGWYAAGQAGEPVFFPAKGYKWNELPRYNADLRARQADLSWAQAWEMLSSRYQDLHGFITAFEGSALYDGPMKGAKNAWTTGRWAEAAGPSHFRSASKYIRARLRAM